MSIERDTGRWDIQTDVVVVGAGGCGFAAAMAAAQGGAKVVVLERSKKPLSNTARSGGMIPAAGTKLQKAARMDDSPEAFAEDILRKNGGTSDPERTLHLARTSRELVDWLVDDVGVRLTFVGNFKYPGHTQFRMHAPPSRTGAALVDDLRNAAAAHANVTLVTGAMGSGLVATSADEVTGVLVRQGPEAYRIGARKVVLATNGFAGNPAMVARHCPAMEGALYFGGEGSTGEGILWGEALGADLDCMDAYQGHATVAHPHGILITYAVVMEGGFQVNAEGRRFSDETRGYSEQALDVLRQKGGSVVTVYDHRIHKLAMEFEDYRDAMSVGAIKSAETIFELAKAFQVPEEALASTLDQTQALARARGQAGGCGFGRSQFKPLAPPYYGVRVTGALFHTQGGLKVDPWARVVRRKGGVIPNLYAGGGVAAGLSGTGPSGYLSGNGLLTALGYGMLAGRHAAKAISS